MPQPENSPSPSSKSLGFLLKVLGLSTILSAAIKYLGPLLPISGSNPLALGVVLTPSLVLGGAVTTAGSTPSGINPQFLYGSVQVEICRNDSTTPLGVLPVQPPDNHPANYRQYAKQHQQHSDVWLTRRQTLEGLAWLHQLQ